MIPNFEESAPGYIMNFYFVSFELHKTFPFSTIIVGVNLP
jgi:hypothetical protein